MRLCINLEIVGGEDAANVEIVAVALRRLAVGADCLGRIPMEFPLLRAGKIVGRVHVAREASHIEPQRKLANG